MEEDTLFVVTVVILPFQFLNISQGNCHYYISHPFQKCIAGLYQQLFILV